MLADLDFGFLSELGTRLSMVLSNSLQDFLLDMFDLFKEKNIDWYRVGRRVGLLWKVVFDVKLDV